MEGETGKRAFVLAGGCSRRAVPTPARVQPRSVDLAATTSPAPRGSGGNGHDSNGSHALDGCVPLRRSKRRSSRGRTRHRPSSTCSNRSSWCPPSSRRSPPPRGPSGRPSGPRPLTPSASASRLASTPRATPPSFRGDEPRVPDGGTPRLPAGEQDRPGFPRTSGADRRHAVLRRGRPRLYRRGKSIRNRESALLEATDASGDHDPVIRPMLRRNRQLRPDVTGARSAREERTE